MIGKMGQIWGILALHVDDTIGGDTDEFHKVMTTVHEALEIGAHEKDTLLGRQFLAPTPRHAKMYKLYIIPQALQEGKRLRGLHHSW